MKITQEIRAAAEAGMLDKAEELGDKSGEIYLPETAENGFAGPLGEPQSTGGDAAWHRPPCFVQAEWRLAASRATRRHPRRVGHMLGTPGFGRCRCWDFEVGYEVGFLEESLNPRSCAPCLASQAPASHRAVC